MTGGKYVTALHNHLQKRKEAHFLSWGESSKGPADALLWTAECKVKGQVLGSGTASQLRNAKEKAAQYVCQEWGISA
ncbi:hypothetical protein HD554DRAFT_2170377 [Boletus coccyginus]|nr:hypothetical protein HD554DRAFT_2170377 [Boletus coccyginus]